MTALHERLGIGAEDMEGAALVAKLSPSDDAIKPMNVMRLAKHVAREEQRQSEPGELSSALVPT